MEYLHLYRLMYSLKKNFIFIYLFCIECFYLNVYMCATFMSGAPGGQKKVLDPWNWSHEWL